MKQKEYLMEALEKYIDYEKEIFEPTIKKKLEHRNIIEYIVGIRDGQHKDYWYYIVYALLKDGQELRDLMQT